MILALKTDQPEAELYLYNEGVQVGNTTWKAHRELSGTLLTKIEELLEASNITKNELTGVVVFKGPGSFTGLRIGITVANTLAYSLTIPVVGSTGGEWILSGIKQLKQAGASLVTPKYGSEAHITAPRK